MAVIFSHWNGVKQIVTIYIYIYIQLPTCYRKCLNEKKNWLNLKHQQIKYKKIASHSCFKQFFALYLCCILSSRFFLLFLPLHVQNLEATLSGNYAADLGLNLSLITIGSIGPPLLFHSLTQLDSATTAELSNLLCLSWQWCGFIAGSVDSFKMQNLCSCCRAFVRLPQQIVDTIVRAMARKRSKNPGKGLDVVSWIPEYQSCVQKINQEVHIEILKCLWLQTVNYSLLFCYSVIK